MKRALRLTAACLVAACLGGCATGESATPTTLPPLLAPRGQPVRGVTLREPGLPMLGSSAIGANSDGNDNSDDGSGIDQYPTMLWLLTVSGVLAEIGAQPVTILAPSETAFRDFKFVDHYGLMSNPEAMAPILRRHVVVGLFDVEQLAAAGTVSTLAGEQLSVWLNGRQLMVNEATFTPPPTLDGPIVGVATLVVHEIDRVLLLPEVSAVP